MSSWHAERASGYKVLADNRDALTLASMQRRESAAELQERVTWGSDNASMCLTAGTPHLRIDNCFSMLQIGAVHAPNEGGLLAGFRFVWSRHDARVTAASEGTLCMGMSGRTCNRETGRASPHHQTTSQTCRRAYWTVTRQASSGRASWRAGALTGRTSLETPERSSVGDNVSSCMQRRSASVWQQVREPCAERDRDTHCLGK